MVRLFVLTNMRNLDKISDLVTSGILRSITKLLEDSEGGASRVVKGGASEIRDVKNRIVEGGKDYIQDASHDVMKSMVEKAFENNNPNPGNGNSNPSDVNKPLITGWCCQGYQFALDYRCQTDINYYYNCTPSNNNSTYYGNQPQSYFTIPTYTYTTQQPFYNLYAVNFSPFYTVNYNQHTT
uniref:Uncharacterized protein n=1 Tax=Panagrolaimus sp. JU765 TaxID=591449 RepID=A0AC34Q3Y2_9BILA